MATTVVMPQMGYDMREGTIVRWRKKEGESVARGEVIAEIETEKAVVEMEAPSGGILGRAVVGEGTTVPVGGPIAIITEPGEEVPDVASVARAEEVAAATAPEQRATPSPKEATAPAAPSGRVRASPIARRLAKEKGIDLRQVKGSGPGGRITEGDVRAFEESRREAVPAASAPAAPPGQPQRVELSRMRLAIGRRTAESKRQAPHFYVTVAVDMTEAVEMRRRLNESLGEERRLTVNDLIIKAAAEALKKFPNLNSTFQDDHLLVYPDVNMGIVLAVEQGLIVPAILQCQDKSLLEVSRIAKDLVKRAQEGVLRPEEYGGATFALSNMGMFDVENFVAVIMPPNSAMLGVGTVQPEPVVKDGEVTVRQRMRVTLSVDHRVTDGVEAARYLAEFRRLLEEPLSLLLN